MNLLAIQIIYAIVFVLGLLTAAILVYNIIREILGWLYDQFLVNQNSVSQKQSEETT